MAIHSSTQIVYMFAPPGTGKTFTGDYMHVVHGYHHIDGDIPIKNMAVKHEYQDLIEKWLVQDDWAPHFSELARLTLEAAKDHDTVVLTHATDRNVIREHVIQKLIEGGAREDNITIIQLTIDPKVKARGIYLRAKRQAEQVGITMTDYCKAWIDSEGEMTEERFTDMFKEQIEPIFRAGREFEVHPNAIMVDVSGRDISHFDNVDKALGLTRSNDWTYKSICEKVKPFDEARDKVMLESGMAEV